MTEQEYIDRGDLVTVGNALSILRDIVPENSSVIEKIEYREVMKTLTDWQGRLFALEMIST